MQGNLRDFSLAEVLQFIALGRRTGLLEILVDTERYRIHFGNGVIVGVNAANDGVVDVLAEANIVPPGVLDAALQESQREGRDLGALLVQSGEIIATDWERFVHRELERLLYSLFSLDAAPFSFQAVPFLTLSPLTLDLPVDRVVLHGSGWAEAWGSLRPPVPSFAAVYAPALAPDAPVTGLPALEQRVLQMVQRPMDVHHIAMHASLGLLETAQALSSLVAAGSLRHVATATIRPASSR